MIVKLICAGKSSFKQLYKNDNDEFIISVDGGIKDVLELGLNIDVALGDFDSIEDKSLLKKVKEIIKYPTIKDFSDLELAIKYSLNLKPKKIEVYNATGLRLDHFVSSLNLLFKYHEYDIKIIDENNEISLLKKSSIINKDDFKYVSFFSNSNETVISLIGFKYELNNYNLMINDNLCLSNEINKEKAEVIINNYPILMIKSK